MSAALNNIRKALDAISKLNYYPTVAGSSIFTDLTQIRPIDLVREGFYRDEQSRKVFDWVCQSRILASLYGIFHEAELENAPFSREEWLSLEKRAREFSNPCEGDYLLDRIDTWFLESYRLEGLCEAPKGCIVLDCGSHTGTTTLYFSQKVGAEGHVYGFEPSPSIYETYERNMRGITNVTTTNCAVSDKKGIISFCEAGPGSSVAQESDVKAYATDIDSFVEKNKLPRVDFIKMDVEGSEEAALRGAMRTIKKYKPKMAIAAYHKEADILTLPQLIHSLSEHYTFSLRHFSTVIFETVLYCY